MLDKIMTEGIEGRKLKWEEVAETMHAQIAGCQKTGKQCRERWHNHLAPELNNSGEWIQEENEILFKYHRELGNKWAKIASYLKGRTDNCVKNHFYSTLRRGMRKVNNFIHDFRKKKNSIKEFKPDVLTKILIVADGDPEQKLSAKNNANTLAKKIKELLIKISLSEEDENTYDEPTIDNVIDLIMEFNKNCKKRKGKKKGPSDKAQVNEKSDVEEEEISEESEIIGINEELNKKKENYTFKEIKMITKREDPIESAFNKEKLTNLNFKKINFNNEQEEDDKDEVKSEEFQIPVPIDKSTRDEWKNFSQSGIQRTGSIEGYIPTQEIERNMMGSWFSGCNDEGTGNLFRSSGFNLIYQPQEDQFTKEIFANSGLGIARNDAFMALSLSGTDERNSWFTAIGDRGVIGPSELLGQSENQNKGQLEDFRFRNSNNSVILSNPGSAFSKSEFSGSMIRITPTFNEGYPEKLLKNENTDDS